MKLLTKEILAKLPKLYETEELSSDEVMVQCKFFDAYGSWSWYLTEYNPDEEMGFGLVKGHEVELGYISLKELSSLGRRIERDLSWKPCTLAALKKELKR